MSKYRKTEDHIHTPSDGRGPRDVFLNGKLINRAFFADTLRGIVRVYLNPPRFDRWGKRRLHKTFHGIVRVLPKNKD